MALIIKGDMPTCCGACKSVQRYRYSDECEYLRKPIARNGRLKDCPILGEIPNEHGDLIDRDFLLKYAIRLERKDRCDLIPVNELENAPTVVEASK